MTKAEIAAAAARAAETMAKDFGDRTQNSMSEVIDRESAAREDLTELRIMHERQGLVHDTSHLINRS
jgi:hypothetical protein